MPTLVLNTSSSQNMAKAIEHQNLPKQGDSLSQCTVSHLYKGMHRPAACCNGTACCHCNVSSKHLHSSKFHPLISFLLKLVVTQCTSFAIIGQDVEACKYIDHLLSMSIHQHVLLHSNTLYQK